MQPWNQLLKNAWSMHFNVLKKKYGGLILTTAKYNYTKYNIHAFQTMHLFAMPSRSSHLPDCRHQQTLIITVVIVFERFTVAISKSFFCKLFK
jgi:hypothetical protein